MDLPKIRRTLVTHESVSALRTPARFRAALERNRRDQSAVNDAMIAAGRGHWRPAQEQREAAAAGDPLCVLSGALMAEARALSAFAERHFGQPPYLV